VDLAAEQGQADQPEDQIPGKGTNPVPQPVQDDNEQEHADKVAARTPPATGRPCSEQGGAGQPGPSHVSGRAEEAAQQQQVLDHADVPAAGQQNHDS
jgi:hypothetical protein